MFRCILDYATNQTHDWGADVVDALKRNGFEVHDYAGSHASSSNFRSAIEQHNPYAIFIFDHGCECDVWGDDGGNFAPLLGIHNAELTRGRVVVVLACSSALVLGPQCIRMGCIAYVGYDDKYGFYSIQPYLDAFKACAIRVFLELAKGQTLEQAHSEAQTLRHKYIADWLAKPPDRIAPVAIAAMRANGRHHILLGNGDVQI